jgi:hypothetical protein
VGGHAPLGRGPWAFGFISTVDLAQLVGGGCTPLTLFCNKRSTLVHMAVVVAILRGAQVLLFQSNKCFCKVYPCVMGQTCQRVLV